jgi:hypothetical protein
MKKKTSEPEADVFTRGLIAGLRCEPAPEADPHQEPTPEDREKLARILKTISDAWRPTANPKTTEPKGSKNE